MRLPKTAIFVLAALALGACAAPAAIQSTFDTAKTNAPAAGGTAAAPGAGAPGAAPAVRAAAPQSAASVNSSNAQSAPAELSDSSLPPLDRMIVATVNLSETATNAVDAERRAEAIAERIGGYIGSSNVRDVDGRRQATVTLRIPSAQLAEALVALRAVGDRVTEESQSTQDVTDQYTDVQSNIRNLQASETRILSLMDKATTIEQILTLERELTNVRGQIERLQGRQRVLENQADMATVSLQITEPVSVPRENWAPGEAFAQALGALTYVGQRLLVLAIWLVVFAPLYGIPLLGAAWWLRRQRPNRLPEAAA